MNLLRLLSQQLLEDRSTGDVGDLFASAVSMTSLCSVYVSHGNLHANDCTHCKPIIWLTVSKKGQFAVKQHETAAFPQHNCP